LRIVARNRAKGKKPSGNARYSITLDTYSLSYLTFLFNEVYSLFSSLAGIFPYPNVNLPQHRGKPVLHYGFFTRALPIFTILHSIWYRFDEANSKFVKIVPLFVADMFSPLSLAIWIMDDGYFDAYIGTIYLCTECFTRAECELLINILAGYGIICTLKVRKTSREGTCRIRISKKSMPLLRELVTPHMHPDFMYKLGENK
jgi:hypothetical protein